jgi:hypothetical protein
MVPLRDGYWVKASDYAAVAKLAEEAVAALRELSENAPKAFCDNFHHSTKDRHAFSDPCAVENRFEAALNAAATILQKAEGI